MTTRLLAYLFSGALILAWVAPPEGLSRYALIIALIIVGAYVDAWARGGRKSEPERSNVISLPSHRKHHRQSLAASQSRERRGMAPIFSSTVQSEVDELLQLLRGEGLHPVLVSARGSEKPHRARYEIHLAHHETERAQAVVKWFRSKAEKHPN